MIDAGQLERSTGDRATLTLAEAIADIAAADTVPPPAAPRRPSDDDARYQALRHYISGRDAAAQGRLLTALVEFSRASELDPDAPEILRESARAYLADGNAPRAAALTDRLLELNPLDGEALFMTAMSRVNEQQYETAAQLLARHLHREAHFQFDSAADALAAFTLALAMRNIGYDRASIEASVHAMDALERVNQPTRFARQAASLARQQGELWLHIGDAHCRLGDYRAAHRAYEIARSEAAMQSASVIARLLYVHLREGRIYTAQHEVLDAVLNESTDEVGADRTSDEMLGLLSYLQVYVDDVAALADAVAHAATERPDDATLVRAAAVLLPPDRAFALLRGFLSQQPDNTHVVGDLLTSLMHAGPPGEVTRGGLDAAIALTLELASREPDLIFSYARELYRCAPNPYALFDRFDAVASSDLYVQVDSATVVAVQAAVAYYSEALGHAWRVCRRGLVGHPDDALLQLVRLQLASALAEPARFASALEATSQLTSARELRVKAAALRQMGRLDDAFATAQQAVDTDDEDFFATLELARVYAALAAQRASDDRSGSRAGVGRDTSRDADHRDALDQVRTWGWRAVELEPTRPEAYEVMLSVFGIGAPHTDVPTVRNVIEALGENVPGSALYERLYAEDELRRQRYEAALERVLRLIDRDPHDAHAFTLAVNAMLSLDRASEAQRLIETHLESRPFDPMLLEQWARLMMESHDSEAQAVVPGESSTGPVVVERRLRDVLDAQPSHAVAQRLLESVLRAMNRSDEAAMIARQRLLDRPGGIRRDLQLATLDAQRGAVNEAREALESALAENVASDRDLALTAIRLAAELESHDPAVAPTTLGLVEQYLDAGWQRYFVVYGIGLRSLVRMAGATGAPDGVTDDDRFDDLLDRAVREAVGPDGSVLAQPTDWTDLAQGLVDEGRADVAAVILRRRVLDGSAVHPRGYGYLITAYLLAEAASAADVDRAISTLDEVIDPSTGQARSFELLGLASGDGPGDLYFEASNIFEMTGHRRAALRLLDEAVSHDPDDAMMLNNLAYQSIVDRKDDVARDPKRLDRMTGMIERAYDLNPDSSSILDTIGWLRYLQGRFDGEAEAENDERDHPEDPAHANAIELLRAALESATEPSAEVLDHLGDALWRVGRHEDAVELWENGLHILEAPDHREKNLENLMLLQVRIWGLLVVEAEDVYERLYGDLHRSLRAKLEAAAAGEAPPIAPTFAERGLR